MKAGNNKNGRELVAQHASKTELRWSAMTFSEAIALLRFRLGLRFLALEDVY